MVEVGFTPGVGHQVMLIATLRWQLFRNSLRTSGVDVAASSVSSIFLGFFALAGSVLFAFGAYFAIRAGKPEILVGLMWAIFFIWQFISLFGTVTPFTTRFDFAEFLRFPLHFSTFVFLSIAYGLLEPVAIIAVFWLFCVGGGITAAKPGMLGWTVLVLVIFSAVNVLLNRAILSWVERWMAQRRTREILAMVFMLFLLGTQLIWPMTVRWVSRKSSLVPGILSIAHGFPPGWCGRALAAGATGDIGQAGLEVAFLASSGCILAWLLTIRLRRQYRGEDLSETFTATAVPGGKTREAGWGFGNLTSPAAAVFGKEILYLLRNWPMLLGLITPLLVPLYFCLPVRGASPHPGFFTPAPDFIFPLSTGFAAMTLLTMVYNSLGFDGPGVQVYLIAPIEFRDVMLGKNLAQGFVLFTEVVLTWAFVSLIFGPPGLAVLSTTLAGLAFVLLLSLAVGNPLAICFPRRVQFGSFRTQRTSGMTGLVNMVVQFFLLGIAAAVFLLARHSGRLWLAAAAFLFLCLPAAFAYLATLNLSNRIAMKRRDTLIAELCH